MPILAGKNNDPNRKYYCSWLSLSPNITATFRLYIEAEKAPDWLELKHTDDLEILSSVKIDSDLKEGKYFWSGDVEIRQQKVPFKPSPKEEVIVKKNPFESSRIDVIAVTKNPFTHQEERCLAGRLWVWTSPSMKKEAVIIVMCYCQGSYMEKIKLIVQHGLIQKTF